MKFTALYDIEVKEAVTYQKALQGRHEMAIPEDIYHMDAMVMDDWK
jgi:hypothetical protein